jgi:hypothetical protein
MGEFPQFVIVRMAIAAQDVWMIPRLQDRKPSIEPLSGSVNWYGTALRIYDPNLDAWRILWNDPRPISSRNRLARPEALTLCKKAPIRGAVRCAGLFLKSSQHRLIGWPSALQTTEIGGEKSTFTRAVRDGYPSSPDEGMLLRKGRVDELQGVTLTLALCCQRQLVIRCSRANRTALNQSAITDRSQLNASKSPARSEGPSGEPRKISAAFPVCFFNATGNVPTSPITSALPADTGITRLKSRTLVSSGQR